MIKKIIITIGIVALSIISSVASFAAQEKEYPNGHGHSYSHSVGYNLNSDLDIKPFGFSNGESHSYSVGPEYDELSPEAQEVVDFLMNQDVETLERIFKAAGINVALGSIENEEDDLKNYIDGIDADIIEKMEEYKESVNDINKEAMDNLKKSFSEYRSALDDINTEALENLKDHFPEDYDKSSKDSVKK